MPRLAAPPPPASVLGRRAILAACLAAVLLLGGGGVAWVRCGIHGCPDVARLAAYEPDGAPLVLDRYGDEIGTLTLSHHVVVPLASLPPYVGDAFIAVEDKRFRRHHGVDVRRACGALLSDLRARGLREGSSTLTMQLAGNLFPERISRQRHTLGRKLLEVRVARAIERAYSKDQILKLYLNQIYFGGGARGIEAAAQHYFGHPAAELSLPEAALLAALPKAPTRYDPRSHPHRARRRRNLVLTLMAQQRRIPPAAAATARASGLGLSDSERRRLPREPFAGWFLEQVRDELEERFGDALYHRRLRVVTTLDARAQHAAEEELDAQLRRIEAGDWGHFGGRRYAPGSFGDDEGTDYLQGAVVFMAARSGDVLAWVGGRDFRHSRFDRVAQARRQLGSAFKPFVYATALADGIPPTRRLSDRPLAIRLSRDDVWRPRNFGGSYLPAVTLRDALVESRNVATVRLAEAIGIDSVAALAERAGLPAVPRQPSAALGASSATPLELTSAYSAFANLGIAVRARFVLRVESPDGEVLWQADQHPAGRQMVDPAVAYVLTDMLRDAVRRGTGVRADAGGLPVPAAGKTGTTNNRQDVWFAGYTPDVVGSVWIGFDQPRTIVPAASGGALAAPVWGRIVRRLYQHRRPVGDWSPPAGVVRRQVDAESGQVLAAGCSSASGRTYREVFLADATPPPACPAPEPRWRQQARGWLAEGRGGDDGASEEASAQSLTPFADLQSWPRPPHPAAPAPAEVQPTSSATADRPFAAREGEPPPAPAVPHHLDPLPSRLVPLVTPPSQVPAADASLAAPPRTRPTPSSRPAPPRSRASHPSRPASRGTPGHAGQLPSRSGRGARRHLSPPLSSCLHGSLQRVASWLELTVASTWDGLPAVGERVRLRLRLDAVRLRLALSAPFHGDPPPDAPPGSTDRLWEREVVELFVAGQGADATVPYTEIEISPWGHHLVLQLRGRRRIAASGLPLRLRTWRRGARWWAAAALERCWLPPLPWRANAFSIHGGGAARRYLAATPVPGDRPDFHQPEAFPRLPLSFEG